MTVSSSTNRATFLGSGVSTVFPLPFRFFSNSDIQASLIDDATKVVTPLTIGTHYTLTGANLPEQNGSAESALTMLAPPAVGVSLFVQRVIPLTQPTDIVNQGAFYPEIHENVFDRITMQLQQQESGIEDANENADAAIAIAAEMEARQDAFELAYSYIDLGDYAAGLKFTSYNQVFRYMGEFYAPSPGINLPYTTTGAGAPEIALFRSVGDGVLRQDLASASTLAGVSLVRGAARVVADIATLRTLPDIGSKTAFVLGHTLFGLGGGMYSQVASDVVSADNNGSVIVAASGMRWKLVNSSELNPFQFGARGDKVTDDTDAIQACYDAVPLGGTMRVYKAPGDAYIVSQQGASGYCLDFSRPVNIVSDGVYASFQPAAGTVVNTVRLKPNPAFYYGGITWDGLSLQDPYTGLRQGFHGIFIDTDVAGSNLPGALLARISIGQGNVPNGVGILHLNNPANNINGGMFGCTIEHGPGIKGGITLEQSGDSNVIRNNIISGSGVGVFFNLITGASLLSIIDNNITTLGGAVRGSSGSRFRIWNNNCEQIAPEAGVTYMINIDGASGTMSSGSIRGNHLGALTGTGITSNIRINNCVGCKIENNVMLPAAAGQKGVTVSAACADTSIGANTYGSGIAVIDRVSDAGVGTMGVRRTAALVNGWVDFGAGFDTLHFYKTSDGMVHIGGTIKSGTVTTGTALFTLPEGFRPSALRLFSITQSAGAGQIFGCISVNSSGLVAIQAGANNQFSLDGVSFITSNGANSVSDL